MTDTKHSRGHSRKLKVGVGGKPVVGLVVVQSLTISLTMRSILTTRLNLEWTLYSLLFFSQQSWQNEVEMQPTSSLGRATAAQNTDSLQENGPSRHPVAQGTQQAFPAIIPRGKKEATTFPAFHSKNAPVKVSVTGEWALKECEVLNHYFIITSFKLHKRALWFHLKHSVICSYRSSDSLEFTEFIQAIRAFVF